MRRITAIVAGTLALVALPASAASASVLVSAPHPFTKQCGDRIEVGVWWRDDGRRMSRRVTISIRTPSGRMLWRRRVRATREWRYWRFTPRCGRRYVVRYRNPGFGVERYKVRIRS